MPTLADQGESCPDYHLCWHDYITTQLSPAHLLSELGFTLVFEVLQFILIFWLYKRVWPRFKARLTDQVHMQIDADHKIEHHEDHAHEVAHEEDFVVWDYDDDDGVLRPQDFPPRR